MAFVCSGGKNRAVPGYKKKTSFSVNDKGFMCLYLQAEEWIAA
jgi:hypothetical protein